MNMTQEQLEAGWRRECEMYSSLGGVRQREIFDEVINARVEQIHKDWLARKTAELRSLRKSSRRK